MRHSLTNVQISRRTKTGPMCKLVNRVDPFQIWRDWFIKREYAKGKSLTLLGSMFGISRQAVWQKIWRCDHREDQGRYASRHREKLNASSKKYYRSHRQEWVIYNQRYQKEHREHCNLPARVWRARKSLWPDLPWKALMGLEEAGKGD